LLHRSVLCCGELCTSEKEQIDVEAIRN